MLTTVYSREELDKIEDQMDNIKDVYKVMLALYGNIQEIQVRAKAQILEADKQYSAASMEIFTNNFIDELTCVEVVIQQFKASFEGVKDDIDIQRIFKMEEILK